MSTRNLRRGLVALLAATLSIGAFHVQAETLRIGYQKYGTLVLLKARGTLEQRLAGQAAGAVAGGNDDSERLGHYLSSRSSTFRERASLSSITGMPSSMW